MPDPGLCPHCNFLPASDRHRCFCSEDCYEHADDVEPEVADAA